MVLAKELATIDAIASGRMTLCVGAGWMEEELDAVGLTTERSFARMHEHVALMRNCWQEGVTSFDGEFYHHVEAGFHPRPPRGTIPVIVGGYGDAALERTARWGDGWAALVRTEEVLKNPTAAPAPEPLEERRLNVLRARCVEFGRDDDELRIIVYGLAQRRCRDIARPLRARGPRR